MMRIIPAIDIMDGKCVRLSRGNYDTKKLYSSDPLDMAKKFENYGVKYLHMVDLDGARSKHIVNYKVLEKIAVKTKLTIDFGGGLKSDDDLRIAFESGADQIIGGSIAVKDRDTFIRWIKAWSKEKIILGADVDNEKIAISGWEEKTDIDLLPFVQNYFDLGIKYLICTDIDKDGMLNGPAIKLYQKIVENIPGIELIASGGVAEMNDLEQLNKMNINGVIVGKAIYENRISLKEIEKFILNKP
ncbi:MAG: 1-(5-phosphoribosyl)-5-[(5-phosphoribosylamino)methylideneamino]imidazole-4-carboxamide isomerase [Bacteroidales bacterium]|nr:1-(5-phosphoribosyl)-5-[(5-phosphoribosylamino)methylideneamino]imidazole-4-carboxamide isomerase [Bacteroidales bacterium]